MQTLNYQLPEAAELNQAEVLLSEAKSYKIDSADMFEAAAEDLKAVKAKAKKLDDLRKSITGPMDEAKRNVMDLFRKPLEFLDQAEAVLKKAMLDFQREEQRKAIAAQAAAEEIARKEREKLEAQAEKAEAKGQTEKADALREVATMAAAPVVTQAPAKVSGISVRILWRAKVTDKAALVRAALERPDLMALLVVDQSALNSLAVALKNNLTIPGVEAYSEESMGATSSR